ncbi:hypothetical protein OROGR_030729 [Orobanche gracilis]
MAIIQAIKQHEDEFDRFVSDDDDEELGESQFNPDIIQKVEELLQVHEVPSYSRVALTNCINEAGNEVHDESFQKLLDLRKKLLDFVDSWMAYLAPNLSAIVGTTVGAKLMATAGGLEPLARMSPCNLQHMGFLNISLDGLPIKLTHGYLQESDISQTFPLAVTRGATRVLASNCSAAARFDFKQNDPSGNTGKHLREVVINKFRSYDKSPSPQFGVLNQSMPPGRKVEELLQVHEVPSYSRVALTSEVGYEIICDSIRLLLSIEKEVYYMYRRQFPEAAESSLVQKSIIDCINEAGNEVHDESFQKLLDLRKKLLDFVDSWMAYLAPNLSAIVGTTVGAKLMATAGGLEPLARMSPCNLQHMGFLNISLDGLPIKLTHGYLQESEISQTFPLAVTRGATRVLASNCSTAARFDFEQNDPSGNTGKHLREVVINKFRSYDKSPSPQFGVLNQSMPPVERRKIE